MCSHATATSRARSTACFSATPWQRNYPKIVDYYLHDGRDRLEATMNNLVAVISTRGDRQTNDPLVAGDVTPGLASIYSSLNEFDPFYRYEFSLTDNPPSMQPSSDEPGLVAVHAMQEQGV
jgi:hypothetical protein